MAILPIIEAPDPRLKTVSTPVETFDEALQVLIDDMFETMYDAPGIGLAAIQVGVPKRLLVMDLQEKNEETGATIREPRVFINPEILQTSEEMSVYNEGCLSVPDQYADVERPKTVRARWLDRDGKRHEQELDEMLATCLQHEMDHLDGRVFVEHLSQLKQVRIKAKLAKQARITA